MARRGRANFTDSGFPHSAPKSMEKGDFTASGSSHRAPKSAEKVVSKISTFEASNEIPRTVDSELGIAQLPKGGDKDRKRCHTCRRYSECYAQCSLCLVAFCGRCLQVRHGEHVVEVSKLGLLWVCPKCRRGCGPGCEKSCCTCSKCPLYKRIQARGNGDVRFLIWEAKYAGFDNLHDYLVHLETGESKDKIAKRKNSNRWITGEKSQHPSQHDCITAPASLEDSSKKKRQKMAPAIDHRSGDIKTSPMQSTYSNECSHSMKAGIDLGTLRKNLHDSLVAFDDMAVDIYLMRLWFNRAKHLKGNEISITLSDKEVALRKAIKARSSAKSIAFEFGPDNFMGRSPCEQKSMKQRLKATLRSDLTDSKIRLDQFYREDVKSTLDSTIEKITAALEKVVDAIPCNSLKQDGN